VRLEYVKNYSIGISGQRNSIMVEMEYLPECSKNRYKLRNGVIKKQVRDWMGCLSFIVRALVNSADLKFSPPVTVRIDGVFKDKRSMPDLHNLLIVVCDAVEDALGINDQLYETETGQPEVGEDVKVVVTVSSEVK